jgi:Domain of unknown function (DUF4926)
VQTNTFHEYELVEYVGPYLPDTGLKSGDVGTILEIYDNENFEVEFCFQDGTTKELCSFHISQLAKATQLKSN